MSGSVWVIVVLGVFVLIVAVLVTLLLVGRCSRKEHVAPLEAPRPRPHGEAVPPTGSR